MTINITFFGPMIDATGKETEHLDVSSTMELKELLDIKYPETKGINYTISVNQEILDENVLFSDSDEIAVLPPFAGG